MEIQMEGMSPFCGVTGWKEGEGILSVEKQSQLGEYKVRQRGREMRTHFTYTFQGILTQALADSVSNEIPKQNAQMPAWR